MIDSTSFDLWPLTQYCIIGVVIGVCDTCLQACIDVPRFACPYSACLPAKASLCLQSASAIITNLIYSSSGWDVLASMQTLSVVLLAEIFHSCLADMRHRLLVNLACNVNWQHALHALLLPNTIQGLLCTFKKIQNISIISLFVLEAVNGCGLKTTI